jgi:hypothetical protein
VVREVFDHITHQLWRDQRTLRALVARLGSPLLALGLLGLLPLTSFAQQALRR